MYAIKGLHHNEFFYITEDDFKNPDSLLFTHLIQTLPVRIKIRNICWYYHGSKK